MTMTATASGHIVQFMEYYNAEVSRWTRAGMPKDSRVVDDFVDYDKIKWVKSESVCKMRLTW
jgi:hypothetical protein